MRWPPDRLYTILFDLDDTLIDSFDARVAALDKAFESSNIVGLSASEFMRGLGGKQFNTSLSELKAELGTSVALYEKYREFYWTKDTGKIRVYPGIESLLSELRAKGLRIGVVTQKGRSLQVNGRNAGAIEELRQLGLTDAFSTVIGMEDVTRYKPHPEGIRLAMRVLASEPEQTLVVGDSFADIEAGRAAGCWTCHATWGLPEGHRSLDGVVPDVSAQTPLRLLTLLGKRGTAKIR